MSPFFFSYKSITITWFMFITTVAIFISYFIAGSLAKEHEQDKNKIEDIFMITLVSGLIGARLTYVLMNMDLYRENMFDILKMSHYNLSFMGGIIVGLVILGICSLKYKIPLEKLLRIFITPFYFSMAIGVWTFMFDKLSLPLNHMKNGQRGILYLSIMFIIGIIIELNLPKKSNYKFVSSIIACLLILLYYKIL
ncbi:prolipoprotein diacylglyceryl transferase Lgt [Anaeromicrobium sediminis]|uniref:Prolipoprotein diacylglyceryl transferase Lgt n=2 Tax=Anaeromicrobium sediminis TaxID=1478221 RepID=A0A267MFQ9_9FIRM|nr:prolipoprotein diacylglyceryl transferase Lgt [Anaeromicrobium sediminis]